MHLFVGIFVLGIIIIVHEFGHFIFCRIFDVKVLIFSVGFGPAIWKRRWGETEYRLSAVPLGGYVSPLDRDRINEIEYFRRKTYEMLKQEGHSDTDIERISDELVLSEYGVTDQDLRNRTLESKPFYAKFLIVFGGPLFNFILGVAAMYFILVLGRVDIGTRIQKVMENSPAEQAGIIPGDEIIEVNQKSVKSWNELKTHIRLSGDKVNLKIKRGDNIFTISVTTIEKDGMKVIGVFPDTSSLVVIKYNAIHAIPMSFVETLEFIKLFFSSIGLILSKEGLESIGGPIAITKITASAVQKGVGQLLIVIFIITINLGILNLLPIPILDGGHILIFSIEAILGRRLSQGLRQAVALVGLLVIISLFVVAMWNDIRNLMGGKF